MDNPSALTAAATPDDDDIIELTDIVEKGAVPGASAPADKPLEAQLSDLQATASPSAAIGADEDFDLDALLQASGIAMEELSDTPDMSSDVPAAPEEPEAPVKGGDEDLPMPAMDDVDALLNNLKVPEQPQSAPAEAAGEEVGVDELDSLLASLDPDVALAPSSAKPAKAEEADVEDLDALLDSIMNPQPVSAAPEESAMPSDVDMEDLDALFGVKPDQPETADAPLEADAATSKSEVTDMPLEAEPAAQEPEVANVLFEATKIAPEAEDVMPFAVPEMEEDPLSGLDELLEGGEASTENELGNPLLVGDVVSGSGQSVAEALQSVEEARADVFRGLEALASDMAVLRDRVEAMEASGKTPENAAPEAFDPDLVRELGSTVERLHADVEEMADRHARGLAVAEARISALEAELAEKESVSGLTLGDGLNMTVQNLEDTVRRMESRMAELESGMTDAHVDEALVQLENRLSALETGGEKAAADAAAKVIREEIAALLADMGQD